MRGRSIKLGEALETFLGKRGRKNAGGRLQAQIDEVWNEVAGEEIANHTKGFGVRDGVLLVHVDTHAWAAQLTYMAEDLRARLNEEIGQDPVRAIRFTVTRTVGDDHKRKANEKEASRRYGGEEVKPVELTREERHRIEREAAGIESERLREAAIRARARALEWKKGKEAAKGRERPPDDA